MSQRYSNDRNKKRRRRRKGQQNHAIISHPRRLLHISIMLPPNLGLTVAVSVREREQGRFRGSSDGARGSNEGAGESREGAKGQIRL